MSKFVAAVVVARPQAGWPGRVITKGTAHPAIGGAEAARLLVTALSRERRAADDGLLAELAEARRVAEEAAPAADTGREAWHIHHERNGGGS